MLEHLAALKSNQIDKAYDLTSSQFRQSTTYREFSRFTDRYNVLRNNVGINFTSRIIEGNMGAFRLELENVDKSITRLDYDIIKEDGAWKVLHIMIKSPPARSLTFGESMLDQFNTVPPKLTNSFDSKENKFIINYPDKWTHALLKNGTVILSGKLGTRAYYSTINVQTILSKKTGGKFRNVKQLVDDIKKQVREMADNAIFLESGPVVVTEKNGAQAKGEYLIFTYTYNGYIYQQWDVIVSRNDGEVFYVWAYTSPQKQYTKDLPLAELILKTWQIY